MWKIIGTRARKGEVLTYIYIVINHLNRFDLWEEVNSRSFYTSMVQHRALRDGAALATKLGQTSTAAGYVTQADNILCFLQVREILH